MSVSTFNPSISPIKFTNKALEHLEKQISIKNAKGIHFKVRKSGCSGFKYLLELAFEIDADDEIYQLNPQTKLYIKPDILNLIRGTEVDYIQEGVNKRLEFKNPNATANCGCGESFSVEQQA